MVGGMHNKVSISMLVVRLMVDKFDYLNDYRRVASFVLNCALPAKFRDEITIIIRDTINYYHNTTIISNYFFLLKGRLYYFDVTNQLKDSPLF